MRWRVSSTDVFLVVVSMLLSLLLWLWVGAEERSEIVLNVPLEYRNIPRNYEVYTEGRLISDVNVWVKGTTATIKNLRPEQVTVWVDLENSKPGQKIYELTPDQVRLPFGFSVLRISPSRINLRIENVVTKNVPVIPRFEGTPPQGFEISQTRITPSQVEVTGPNSAVATVKRVITDTINVSNLSGNYTERVNIGVENSAVRLGPTKEVIVSLMVSEIQDAITLRQVPVSIKPSGRNARFNPKTVRLELLGPKRLLSELSREDAQAVLEIEELEAGIYDLTPQIVLADRFSKDVSVRAVTPARIHIRIP